MTLFKGAYTNYQIQFRANAVRVAVFVLFACLLASLITLVLGDPMRSGARTYRAVFTNASGLVPGSSVRAAGVEVGTVSAMRLRPDHTVLVTFGVRPQVGMTSATEARVRYANLTGDRYLELTAPAAGSGAAGDSSLPAGRPPTPRRPGTPRRASGSGAT